MTTKTTSILLQSYYVIKSPVPFHRVNFEQFTSGFLAKSWKHNGMDTSEYFRKRKYTYYKFREGGISSLRWRKSRKNCIQLDLQKMMLNKLFEFKQRHIWMNTIPSLTFINCDDARKWLYWRKASNSLLTFDDYSQRY